MQITTIGLDIAKNVFQVHGIDAAEKVVVRKQLRRGQVMKFFEALSPCLVGMEACATAHYWAQTTYRSGSLLSRTACDARLHPTCRSRKFDPGQIRVTRQNQCIVQCDACDPAVARGNCRQSVQVAAAACGGEPLSSSSA